MRLTTLALTSDSGFNRVGDLAVGTGGPSVSSVDLLKVSAWSNPKSVAGAIAGVLRERGSVDVQVIGAAALNQAVKAIAIARSYTSGEGIDPICIPAFQDIEINGEGRTALRLHVEDRADKLGLKRGVAASAGADKSKGEDEGQEDEGPA
jgi:stage V sporulation protein S